VHVPREKDCSAPPKKVELDVEQTSTPDSFQASSLPVIVSFGANDGAADFATAIADKVTAELTVVGVSRGICQV